MRLGNVKMDFSYTDAFGGRTPDAYETLLLDCLQGDATLYADSDWIEKSWELLMPLLEAWHATFPVTCLPIPQVAGAQRKPSHSWTRSGENGWN